MNGSKKRSAIDDDQTSASEDNAIVNTEKASRGIWLVKVPRYLSEVWEKNAGGVVGKLVTARNGSATETTFHNEIRVTNPQLESTTSKNTLSASSTSNQQNGPRPIPIGKPKTTITGLQMPTQHKFIIRNLNNQSLAVLSEDKTGLDEEADFRTGKLSIEGQVVFRADCQPPNSTDYMKMKIRQIQKVSQPKKTVKQMERAVVKFKPTNAHQEHLVKDKARKEGAKALRLEKDEVIRLLFNAFEKHQFYRQADLQRLTNQPANAIREALNDIGLYHETAPHRAMWELKPEYRNYNKELAKNVEAQMMDDEVE